MGRVLTHREARDVYNRIGAMEDVEQFIEGAAIRALAEFGRFHEAGAVLEFGAGTGSFAELLFREYLPADASYLGLDVSPVMVELAREKLAPFRERAAVRLTEGSVTLDLPDASFDRVVSAFVLDLLSPDDIRTLLSEGHRILRPSGLLCLASLTYGRTPVSRLVTGIWVRLRALNPRIVGGCRPVNLHDFLPAEAWHIGHARVFTTLGVSTEVIVASPSARP